MKVFFKAIFAGLVAFLFTTFVVVAVFHFWNLLFFPFILLFASVLGLYEGFMAFIKIYHEEEISKELDRKLYKTFKEIKEELEIPLHIRFERDLKKLRDKEEDTEKKKNYFNSLEKAIESNESIHIDQLWNERLNMFEDDEKEEKHEKTASLKKSKNN